jgi:ATP-dependent DNA helicase
LEKLVIQKGKFKSLLDGVDSKGSKLAGMDVDEVKGVLGNEEFEKYDVDDKGGKTILSEEELKILTDRSDKAYERAAGKDGAVEEGRMFKVAETKGDGVLADLTTKGGASWTD